MNLRKGQQVWVTMPSGRVHPGFVIQTPGEFYRYSDELHGLGNDEYRVRYWEEKTPQYTYAVTRNTRHLQARGS